MFDVVSLAEAVIDFSQCGVGKMNNPAFEMNPGGSGCNVLVPTARLGGRSACLGLVGQDLFGDYIIKFLKARGINTDGMNQTPDYTTRLAFVAIDEDGDRFFNFVKGSGMKHLLRREDIDYSIVDQAKILSSEYCHEYDSVGAKTIMEMVRYSVDKGIDFAFDFNYRPGVFADEEKGIAALKGMLDYASYVKACETEMAMITGLSPEEYEEGAHRILEMDSRKKAVFITLGAQGAYYCTREECGYVPGFAVKAVDTTGCGDSFMGTVLYYLANPEEGLNMREIVRRANAMGALCATKPGGIDAVPTKAEMLAFLEAQKGEA